MNTLAHLDKYLLPEIRSLIEQRYYAQINTQAHLDQLVNDLDFLTAPEKHMAFFSDHGVVHVRDVAQQILKVLDIINGVLIPARTSSRLESMKGYGVIVAYLHDLGMADFSQFGRAMHPEVAAQIVFQDEFDKIIQTIWDENCGNIAWRLFNLANQGYLELDPKVVLREMVAMSVCHSKSKVPIKVLNNLTQLRRVMQTSIGTDLHILYHQQQVEKARKKHRRARQAKRNQAGIDQAAQALEEAETQLEKTLASEKQPTMLNEVLRPYYVDFQRDAFAWLESEFTLTRHLVNDVIDTLRALRCADALRQRGTVLNTSGGYQIFVDRQTANAIHAFKKGADEMLILLETDDAIAAGEANVASSQLTIEGDLRIAFHRGSFANQQTIQYAAKCAAIVVNDVQADVINSFHRLPSDQNAGEGLKAARDMQILLEGVDDNPEFAGLISRALEKINPQLQGKNRPVPSLQNMSDHERILYLNGQDLHWDAAETRRVLAKIAESGQKVRDMDLVQAFAGLKLIEVEADEVLIVAGSPPGFVYIALAEGLKGTPLGGYRPFSVYPWTPLGNTGVIRGAARNATIVAEKPLELLMIPKEIYLKYWHSTYSKEEFRQLIPDIYGSDGSIPK